MLESLLTKMSRYLSIRRMIENQHSLGCNKNLYNEYLKKNSCCRHGRYMSSRLHPADFTETPDPGKRGEKMLY